MSNHVTDTEQKGIELKLLTFTLFKHVSFTANFGVGNTYKFRVVKLHPYEETWMELISIHITFTVDMEYCV